MKKIQIRNWQSVSLLVSVGFLACVLAMTATSCGKESKLVVENSLPFDRVEEMVEFPVADLVSQYPEGFVIVSGEGAEVPYQLTYDGKLIFKATVGANSTAEYIVRDGKPAEVKASVFGRKFPEHKDNMNWENEKAAYVAYGPALQAAGERGFGYDIWTKSVDTLVLEMRNKLELEGISMHKDNGNGMDAYIVSSTLGGGTAALLDSSGNIIYPWAWKEEEVLDNGPLRFTVKLTYHPAVVENDSNVVETRVITLDSGSHLNRTEVIYSGLTTPRDVAAGIVVHTQNPEGYKLGAEQGWMSYRDSTEDTHNDNGVIYLGVVAPGAKFSYLPIKEEARDALGHILAVKPYGDSGFTYWWGSGWSKGSMPDDWDAYLEECALKAESPLKVSLK